MQNQSVVRRHPCSLDEWVDRTCRLLFKAFSDLEGGDVSFQEFEIKFINPALNYPLRPDDDPLDILMELLPSDLSEQGEDYAAKLAIAPIFVSVTYAMHARIALHSQKNQELAWSYLGDARYWSCFAVGKDAMEKLAKRVIAAQRYAQGKSGGEERAKRFQPVKKVFFDLVRKKSRKGAYGVLEDRPF